MRTHAVIFTLLLGVFSQISANAKENELVFASDFEGNPLAQPWSWIMGCQLAGAEPRSGESALLCAEGSSSIVSKYPVAEAGLLEFWVKPQNSQTQYRINVLTSPVLKLDAKWQHVALIDVSPNANEYLAHRVSIDDPSRQYIRLDIEAVNGPISLDDLTLDK
ncbi:MAG: BAR domain-like protein A BdpA, partial [Shewanella sp.]